MQARSALDYSTEAKPGLVITEESDGFVAYRKKRTFSHWLLMGFVVGAAAWFLILASIVVAVAVSNWYDGESPTRVVDALLHASRHEVAQRFLVPVEKLAVIVPFTVGLACLGFFSAADWRVIVNSNKLRITNTKGSVRRQGGAENIERMRVNWHGLEFRFRATSPLERIPCTVTIAKRKDARLLRSMIAKHLVLIVDEKSGRCHPATAVKPPGECEEKV
jgi:hypothetical protein